jgi:hypothetical protein
MQTKIATPGTVVHRVKNDRTVQDCATKLDKFQTTLAVEINKAYSRMIISTESSPKGANKFLLLSFQEVRHDHISRPAYSREGSQSKQAFEDSSHD